MIDITFEYWNKLAEQTTTISSLLGGFSIAVIANILVSEVKGKLHKYIMVASTLAACFFLVTVFSMTNLLLKTTPGYPMEVVESDLVLPSAIGAISFYLGTISLLTLIALAGWTKSKRMGRFTTAIGVVTLILTLMMTSI